jgi:hypothetical protein
MVIKNLIALCGFPPKADPPLVGKPAASSQAADFNPQGNLFCLRPSGLHDMGWKPEGFRY